MRNAKTGGFVKSVAPPRRKSVKPAVVVPSEAIEAAALAAVIDTFDAPAIASTFPVSEEPAVPAAVAAVSRPVSVEEPVGGAVELAPVPSPRVSADTGPVASDASSASAASGPDRAPAPVTTPTATEETSMNDTIQAVTDKTQTMFADANERTKGAMEKGKVMIEELNSFSKGNIEAMVESSKIAAKGIETMAQDAAEYAKTSFEGATQAIRTMATVKSPTELMKIQSDYMRTAFDALVAHTSRSTEMMMKLAGDVAQPVSSRMAIAAEKVKISA